MANYKVVSYQFSNEPDWRMFNIVSKGQEYDDLAKCIWSGQSRPEALGPGQVSSRPGPHAGFPRGTDWWPHVISPSELGKGGTQYTSVSQHQQANNLSRFIKFSSQHSIPSSVIFELSWRRNMLKAWLHNPVWMHFKSLFPLGLNERTNKEYNDDELKFCLIVEASQIFCWRLNGTWWSVILSSWFRFTN